MKRYLQDPSVSIPRRTRSRHRHSTPIEDVDSDATMDQLDFSYSSLADTTYSDDYSTAHDTLNDGDETETSSLASLEGKIWQHAALAKAMLTQFTLLI